jgi:ubiquinone/menaquinone biosynthesis C-methylase UbiE
MSDDFINYNRARWNAIAGANILYSRPWLDLTEEMARWRVDILGLLGDVSDKEVLCLAAGGGQQSVAFTYLGANVTVFDLSDTMLERDRQAADHYNYHFRIEQGDMRDLSRFDDDSFDVVWQAYSINFVPDVRPVFDEVKRVLKDSGIYRIEFRNPLVQEADEERWNGEGYVIKERYQDGEMVFGDNNLWPVENAAGNVQQIEGPREWNHTFKTVLNNLAGRGFIFLGLHEDTGIEENPEPGSWGHFMSVIPPWIEYWWRLEKS